MKKIATLILMVAMTLGAVAQEDCPPPETQKLSVKERREMKEYLDALLKDWKKIGASGENPAISFEDLDKSRILISSTYNLDDSNLVNAESSSYDFIRVMALYDILARLKSPIFETVAKLGYDVALKVNYRPDLPQRIFAYDNATLNRFLELDNLASAMIYADAIMRQKEIPFEFADSIMCTGVSYCNHLWTMHLQSNAKLDAEADPRLEWMFYLSYLVEDREFLYIIGMDGSTARFVVAQDGVKDTMTFEYTPAQLLGEEPTMDIDQVGPYMAKTISRSLPQPLPDGDGTFEICEYDPSLKVLVFNYLVSELTILNNEGKEAQIKPVMLNAMMNAPNGQDFFSSLVELGMGIELRMQSRTTRRTSTVTYTPDELRIYMLEQQ